MPTLLQGDLELVRVCEQRAYLNTGCDDQHLPAHHRTAHDPGQFEDCKINPSLLFLPHYFFTLRYNCFTCTDGEMWGGGGLFIYDMSHYRFGPLEVWYTIYRNSVNSRFFTSVANRFST